MVHKVVQAWVDRGVFPRKVSSSWSWSTFGNSSGVLGVMKKSEKVWCSNLHSVYVDFSAKGGLDDFTCKCLVTLDISLSTGLPIVLSTQVIF